MESLPLSDPDGLGAVAANEVIPLEVLAQRLGWGQRTISRARDAGLRLIPFGRRKYARGVDVLEFFDRLSANEKEDL